MLITILLKILILEIITIEVMKGIFDFKIKYIQIKQQKEMLKMIKEINTNNKNIENNIDERINEIIIKNMTKDNSNKKEEK